MVVPIPDRMPWEDLINRLAPPDVFFNEGFFEEKEIIEDDLNEAQNTHTASVNQSVAALLNFIKELSNVEGIGVEAIWNKIQGVVANQLFEEFGSLYTGKNDPNSIALIDTGIYTTYSLPSFQKELSESNGYRDYCRSLMHISYRFFGRSEEYKEDSKINPGFSFK
jgi:hypothetical protein